MQTITSVSFMFSQSSSDDKSLLFQIHCTYFFLPIFSQKRKAFIITQWS